MRACQDYDRDALVAFSQNGELANDTKFQDFEVKNLNSVAGSTFSGGNIYVILGLLVIGLGFVFFVIRKRKS